MSKNNNEIKHEDLIMKKAMDVFAEEGLKFFGINTFKKSMKTSAVNGVYLNSAKLNIRNGKNDSIRKNAACPEYAVIAEVLILSANAL